jgi:cytoskeletal protein RodZ
MWLLVLLLAVSVVVTALVRRRGRDTRDSLDDQQRRLDALRLATSGENAPPGEMGGGTATRPVRSRGSRRSVRITGRGVLVAVGVLAAGIAVYALAAGWDTTNARDESGGANAGKQARTSTTTASSTTTTTTAAPAVPAIVGTQGGTVTISVPAGPYRLSLTARDSCWILVERPDGTVVTTTTLGGGESREVDESGPLSVQLGNPAAVDLVIDDHPLTLPASNGGATKLDIVPAA